MTRSLLAACVAAFVLFPGCGSEPLQLTPHEKTEGPWHGTAALLNYGLEASDADILKNGCTLVLSEKDTHREYRATLPGNERSILFDAPAGTYVGKTLNCPSGTKWELTSFLKGSIPILTGKINYLGKTEFRFAPRAQGVVVAQADQKGVTHALTWDLRSFPAQWKEALVNPFSDKPITEDMLGPSENEKAPYRMDIHTKRVFKHGQTPSLTDELSSALRQCDLSEQKRFPYRLGTFHWTAVYSGGTLQKLDENSHGTFSDDFVSCMESAIRGFHPTGNDKIVLTVSL